MTTIETELAQLRSEFDNLPDGFARCSYLVELAALLPVLRRFAQSYAALGPAAKKTIEALLPELAALLEAAEGAMQ